MWEEGKGIKHFKYISTISSKLGQGFTSRTDDLYDLYDLFSFHDLDMPGRADIICDIYIYITRFPSGKLELIGEWRKNETKSIQRGTNTTTPEILQIAA